VYSHAERIRAIIKRGRRLEADALAAALLHEQEQTHHTHTTGRAAMLSSKPQFTKGTVKVLSGQTGHSVIEFDLESKEGVEAAQKAISGFGARAVFDAHTREQIDNPRLGTHEEYLVVPPMAGGR